MVVGWLDSRESLQNKELNKRNIGWKTSLLFTNIQSIPAYSWSVARQRQLRKTMVTRVTKMVVIKVIKFNVKFTVGEIVDKGMQLHIDKGQEAENCRRVGGTKSENLADVFFVLFASWLVTVSRLIRRHILQLFQSQILTPALSKCT